MNVQPPDVRVREGATGHFEGFDAAGFWDDSAYALGEYVEEAPPRGS